MPLCSVKLQPVIMHGDEDSEAVASHATCIPSGGTTRTDRGGCVPTVMSLVVSRMVSWNCGILPPPSGVTSIDGGSEARTTSCAEISVPPPGLDDEHRPRVSQVSVPLQVS